MTALVATLALLALVWTMLVLATSAVLSFAWPRLHVLLRSLHPATRNALALAVATAPVLIPTAVVALAVLPGMLGVAIPGLDHCSSHPEHPHLCLAHPSASLTPGLALFLGLLLTATGLSLAQRTRAVLAAERRLRELRARASLSAVGETDRIESSRSFSFTHGYRRPRTLISSAMAEALRPEQLAIVVAHERAHARRRDPLRQVLARTLSVPLWPSVRTRLLAELELSAEMACDEAAAQLGDRLAVADTILAVERSMGTTGSTTLLPAVGIGGGSLTTRIESLLDEAPGDPVSHLGWVLLAVCLALVAGAGLIHHETEHVFASLIAGS